MAIIQRKVKLVTEQHNIPKESPMADFPMKEWSVKIFLVDQAGNEHPANCFTKVQYNLHPSFENPHQSKHLEIQSRILLDHFGADRSIVFTDPPFLCKNEGWGEFEMSIDLYTTEKGGKTTIFHDLNFQSPSYEVEQSVTFKNPSQALVQVLRETGPVPNDDDTKSASKARKTNDSKKRKPAVDFEKMGDALGKLSEDDLLQVIQMIHDHKSDDTYTKNDIEAGEFTVDLFTLSDSLAKMIWDFLTDLKMVY
ncbi:SAS complex, SAS5 subunit/transcription initiation factor IID, subunit 14 [Xylariaceae sp. FL0662B]|nr:SAS complex, SAS5 subunit/transcription initiation factor IID, subunit 14 [Xylariaceae sp. FL0662B]